MINSEIPRKLYTENKIVYKTFSFQQVNQPEEGEENFDLEMNELEIQKNILVPNDFSKLIKTVKGKVKRR